jgi:hypothetical protein
LKPFLDVPSLCLYFLRADTVVTSELVLLMRIAVRCLTAGKSDNIFLSHLKKVQDTPLLLVLKGRSVYIKTKSEIVIFLVLKTLEFSNRHEKLIYLRLF